MDTYAKEQVRANEKEPWRKEKEERRLEKNRKAKEIRDELCLDRSECLRQERRETMKRLETR